MPPAITSEEKTLEDGPSARFSVKKAHESALKMNSTHVAPRQITLVAGINALRSEIGHEEGKRRALSSSRRELVHQHVDVHFLGVDVWEDHTRIWIARRAHIAENRRWTPQSLRHDTSFPGSARDVLGLDARVAALDAEAELAVRLLRRRCTFDTDRYPGEHMGMDRFEKNPKDVTPSRRIAGRCHVNERRAPGCRYAVPTERPDGSKAGRRLVRDLNARSDRHLRSQDRTPDGDCRSGLRERDLEVTADLGCEVQLEPAPGIKNPRRSIGFAAE